MRDLTKTLMGGVFAASLLAGCSGSNSPTSPTNGGNTPPPTTGQGGGSNSPPSTAAVNIGDIFFKSAMNGSSNPAVDTVAVNGTVTWTWTVGDMPHSVHSLGSPSFTSSAIQTGSGNTYQFQFTTPGTYQYDCAVHGTLMTGMIVVIGSSGSSTPPSSMPPPSAPPPGY